MKMKLSKTLTKKQEKRIRKHTESALTKKEIKQLIKEYLNV